MSEEGLQAAVISLEASTTAINRQTEILRAQRKHLDLLPHEPSEINQRLRTERLESQNLKLVVGKTLALLFLPYKSLAGGR